MILSEVYKEIFERNSFILPWHGVIKKPLKNQRLFCGEYRIRTDDLLHAMQAL